MDLDDFERFHGATRRGLWGYLRRLGGDEALAEDVLQESYLKYLLQPPAVAEERGRRAYLYRIGTNLLRDRQRRRQRERQGLAAFFEKFPGRTRPSSGTPERLDVDAALTRLKSRERALLWLACVEGCSHREIAEILGLREPSVRVLLSRARNKLARELAGPRGNQEGEP